ncbi:MAG: EAL and GGDEF domain-containing protein [Syntrophales bacterium]|nr:EAL and GGDEF domain-containing protein [Syntrophales bacterium]
MLASSQFDNLHADDNSLLNCEDSKVSASEFIAIVQPQPYFHPIIDLYTASVVGYECLARGIPPYELPRDMFEEAKKNGLELELEKACVEATLKTIRQLPHPVRDLNFFINVSPSCLADLNFLKTFNSDSIMALGLNPGQFVLEVTEQKSFESYEIFQRLSLYYMAEGFKIGLDDFGAGYSGLTALIASTPHYLKLDMAIVRDVHLHAYKQKLVKSIASFASSVDAKLIAEGVETWEELEVLIRYGVRYVQGFLFDRPKPMPVDLDGEMRKKIVHLVEKYDGAKIYLDRRIGDMISRPPTVPTQSVTCRDISALFKKNSKIDHLVLVNGEGKPKGLITRQHFFMRTGGAFGYELFSKKHCDLVSKTNFLAVEEKTTVTNLARLAMDRFPEDLYDPVIVVDEKGMFIGTVTMKDVITKATELEVRSAMATNPLTNLPGNEVIRHWLQEALAGEEFAVLYIDLDNFKGYNDSYGFLMGDELIRFTANVLSKNLSLLHPEAKLGHIGGDDFMIICPGLVSEKGLDMLCWAFDTGKIEYFKPADVKAGYVNTFDRQGRQTQYPLVTMSIAVIDHRSMNFLPHPAHLSEAAASLKKIVKALSAERRKSSYMFDRRRYEEMI